MRHHLPRSSRGRAVLLTPLGSVRPIQLPFYKHTAPVSPLFALVTKSAQPIHSTLFSCPLFSTACRLFCTHQKLNSFVFKQFQPLFRKHPGVGGTTTRSSEIFPARRQAVARGPRSGREEALFSLWTANRKLWTVNFFTLAALRRQFVRASGTLQKNPGAASTANTFC